jgi:hypothetical protein
MRTLFIPATKIKFTVGYAYYTFPVQVTLKVFDVLGNEIAKLVDENSSLGNYKVVFNASTLPSGVYFYRLQTGDYVQTRKMIFLK